MPTLALGSTWELHLDSVSSPFSVLIIEMVSVLISRSNTFFYTEQSHGNISCCNKNIPQIGGSERRSNMEVQVPTQGQVAR